MGQPQHSHPHPIPKGISLFHTEPSLPEELLPNQFLELELPHALKTGPQLLRDNVSYLELPIMPQRAALQPNPSDPPTPTTVTLPPTALPQRQHPQALEI